jgi:phenylalanyl-tRNA synthetase beta chain
MLISVRWLADYVEVPAVEELAERLTLAGFEVERTERPGEALAGVVVAEIKESAPHPNAEKLSVTRVDTGGRSLLQIVCGAKNYKIGDKVPLATVGARLPNGTEIRQASLRGVESFGMLCSAKELAISEDASGLMILDASTRLGEPLAQALGLDDAVLEIEVTPNRPDALSHLGIAREVSVLTGKALRRPELKLTEGSGAASDRIKIRIEDPVRCPRYAGRIVEGVSIGPSPAWMASRLKVCGVRPINNVVDVTNYVLLEYGEPLHAFDLDRLAGPEIIVRTARPGERMTTLDGKERVLDPEDLLICDRDAPQALAGVMGGGDSEVSSNTKRILIEAANFQPSSVRRTAKRHGLHTEASHRFERGMDVNAIPDAVDRAAALIAQLSRGTVLRGRVDVYPRPIQPAKVVLRYGRVSELLGTKVSADETDGILRALGFVGEQEDGRAIYSVPTFRVDVQLEEDLIEEVARIRGYDSVPNALPRGVAELAPEPREAEAERRIRSALAGAGFNEVVNYSFVSPRELAALEAPAGIPLRNPLSVEQSVMRTTLFAGLLQNLSHSLRYPVETVRLYELARIYLEGQADDTRQPIACEPLRLSGTFWGRRDRRTWTSADATMDFFDGKGAVECVLSALGIQGARFESTEHASLHPRASAAVRSAKGDLLGIVGELHPRLSKRLDVPTSVFAFELDADKLYSIAELVPSYRPMWRYPPVLRDLAVVVPVELRNDDVRAVILEIGQPLVDEALIFDVYTGKPLPDGKKNLAYAIRYRAADRTLTDAEVNEAHQRIIEEVNRRLGGSLRGSGPA